MGLLTLCCGTLLPWIGGGFWLSFIESRLSFDTRPNRFRQAGYGFFLGYALLFLLIVAMNSLNGHVSWPWILVFLSVFAGSGALACWFGGNGRRRFPPAKHPAINTPVAILTAIPLIWMSIHLAFVTVELISQPLFPWDAWTVWVYRAKAWFLAGEMVDVVSSAEWGTAISADIYTVGAWRYPLFSSVIPYWAALSLGRWSETLVNLPVLFAAIAIGLALYGQCREHGLGIPASLICCYLLFSIPLYGTHIALAGYADIWMAGFTGLGFIALCRGAGMHKTGINSSYQVTLGLLMIMLGMLVKNEGLVWFLTSLLLLMIVSRPPRLLILGLLTLVSIVLLAWVAGISSVNIPFVGTLGLVENGISIPFIGKFLLETHNIWPVYWENFFLLGNWNLFWVLIFAGMLPSVLSPGKLHGQSAIEQFRRNGMGLIGLFLATQFIIFGLTDKGLWADTYTAINRLPLHFVPALLYVVFVNVHTGLHIRSAETNV